jgi:hypothetical protein
VVAPPCVRTNSLSTSGAIRFSILVLAADAVDVVVLALVCEVAVAAVGVAHLVQISNPSQLTR